MISGAGTAAEAKGRKAPSSRGTLKTIEEYLGNKLKSFIFTVNDEETETFEMFSISQKIAY